MKRIIDGKTYDTRTAKRICNLPCPTIYDTDFYWHDTGLYKTPAGIFFVAGEGNALSMWAETHSRGGRIAGSGLRLITEKEAREFAEAARLNPVTYEAAFGTIEIG